LLDLRASRLHQLAVLNAGRTCGLAGAAIQASIDVRDERVAKRETPLIDKDHLTNSAARRIGFLAPELICRTIIQAQSAMNAPRVIVIRRLIGARKAARRRGI